ncbi:MAG TPA: hypothetical protein VMW27_27120 [Thermoanaerobaculia bacterium]|nr:hypothetical protein [Thermoanaerobaculia bacterium]
MSESVPFLINVYGGFGVVTGLVRCQDDQLRFELQVKDSIVGALKGPIKTVDVPLSQVEDVELKPGMGPVKARLVIRVSDLKLLEEIPGEHGELRLLIQGRHRQAAERLASSIQLRLSERELQRL